ncbi:MAG: hypothetical protein KBC67_00815 [Candidatus Pacebacteria bacterium]|nr:hypothetical protein [Candidatus Paceibacterota bacterium]
MNTTKKRSFKLLIGSIAFALAALLVANSAMTARAEAPYTVTIAKYINGAMATSENTNNGTFSMHAVYPGGEGDFNLSSTGFNNANAYMATTADMPEGSNYSVSENTPASCTADYPYMLAGYTTGTTMEEAAAATPTMTAPSFTNMMSNQHVIVWNKTCSPAPVHATPANDSTMTSAAWTMADWSDVTTPAAGAVTYIYQSSHIADVNADGSFTTPSYTSGALTSSQADTTGTPNGTYYWHVKAIDGAGNSSAWSTPWKITIADDEAPATSQVHIVKYLDGAMATAASANSYMFPMSSTWTASNLNGGAETSGSFTLGNNHGGATDAYGAMTAEMNDSYNYTTWEVTDGDSHVLASGATCVDGKYRLVGYKTSSVSFADAATQTSSTTAPNFSGATGDRYVIVYNESCGTVTPPTDSTLVQMTWAIAIEMDNALANDPTNKYDWKALGDVTDYLAWSLNESYWSDADHVMNKKVQDHHGKSVRALTQLKNSNKGMVSAATLQGWIDRIIAIDREIATNQIDQATAWSGKPAKITKANNWVTTGDGHRDGGQGTQSVTDYQTAWKFAWDAVSH